MGVTGEENSSQPGAQDHPPRVASGYPNVPPGLPPQSPHAHPGGYMRVPPSYFFDRTYAMVPFSALHPGHNPALPYGWAPAPSSYYYHQTGDQWSPAPYISIPANYMNFQYDHVPGFAHPTRSPSQAPQTTHPPIGSPSFAAATSAASSAGSSNLLQRSDGMISPQTWATGSGHATADTGAQHGSPYLLASFGQITPIRVQAAADASNASQGTAPMQGASVAVFQRAVPGSRPMRSEEEDDDRTMEVDVENCTDDSSNSVDASNGNVKRALMDTAHQRPLLPSEPMSRGGVLMSTQPADQNENPVNVAYQQDVTPRMTPAVSPGAAFRFSIDSIMKTENRSSGSSVCRFDEERNGFEGGDRSALVTVADASAFYPQQNLPTEAAARGLMSPSAYPSSAAVSGKVGTRAMAPLSEFRWRSVSVGEPAVQYSASLDDGQDASPSSGIPEAGFGQLFSEESSNNEPTDLSMTPSAVEEVNAPTPKRKRSLEGAHAGMDSGNESTSFRSMESEEDINFSSPTSPEDGTEHAVEQKKLPTVNSGLSEMEELPATPADMQAASTKVSAVEELDDEVMKDPSLNMDLSLLGDPDAALKELRGYRWKKKLAAEKFGSAASAVRDECPKGMSAQSVSLEVAAGPVLTPPVPQKETTVAVGKVSSVEQPMLASAVTDPVRTSSVPKGVTPASNAIFSPLLLLAARSEVESKDEPDAAREDEEKVERAVAQRTTKKEVKTTGLYPVRKKNSRGQVRGSILAPNVGDDDDIPMLEPSTGEEPMESSNEELSSAGKSPMLPTEILVEASKPQDHSEPTEAPLRIEKQVLDKPGSSVVRRRCESAEKEKKIQAFVKEKAMKHARPLGSVEAPPVILEERLRKRTEKKNYHLADWGSPPTTRNRGSRNSGKRGRGVGASEIVRASRGRSVPRPSGRGRGGLRRARGGRARAISSETPGQEEHKSPGIKMTFKRDTEETSYVCSFNDDDPESPEAGAPVSNVASTSSEIAPPVRSSSSHNRGGRKKSGQVEAVQRTEGIDSMRRRHKSQPSNSQKKAPGLPCKRRVSFINSPRRAQPEDDESNEHEDAVKPKRRRLSVLKAASGNDQSPPSRRTSRLLSQETNVSLPEPTEAIVLEQQEIPTTPEPLSAMESPDLTPKRRMKPQMKAEAVVKSPENGIDQDPEHDLTQEDFIKLEMMCAVFDGQCPPFPRHSTIGGGNGVTDDLVTPKKAAVPENCLRTEVGPAEEVFGRDESPEPFALDDVAMSDVSHQGADDLHLPPLDSDLLSPATPSLGDERMERSFLASPERVMGDTSTGHREESDVQAKPSLPKNLESKLGSGTVDIVDLAIEADDTVDLRSEAGESDYSDNTLRLLGYDDFEQERPSLDPELDPRITHEMLMTRDSIPVLKLERPSLADDVERSAFSHGTVRPYNQGKEIFHLTLDRRHKKDTLFPWQITNEFFLEITPPPGALKGGMRVCAYWSECKLFYPGVVEIAEENRAYVHFDDEDYKWIQRERIRMLSQDFTVPAVIDIEQSRGKKKRKSGSSLGGDSMDTGSMEVVEERVQSPPFLAGVENTQNARGDDMDVESVEEPSPSTRAGKTDDVHSSEKKKKKKHKREKERKKSKKDKEHKEDRKDESGQGRSKTPSGSTKDEKDEMNKEKEGKGGQSQPKPQRPSSAKKFTKAGDSKDSAEAQERPKSANKVRPSTPKEPVKPKNPSKEGAKDEKPKSSHRGGSQKKSEKEIQRPDFEPVSSDTADPETEYIAGPAEYRSPKIPLLSPDKAPWMFIGDPTVAEDRRTYYEGIARGKLVLKPNDCAIFRSSEVGDPYVGQMTGFYRGKKDMKVVVHWFYRNYEVEKVDPMVPPMGLFSSTHADSVDVDSIEDRCRVVSYEEYKARRASGAPLECETYFRAGEYDAQKRKWKLQEDFEKELQLFRKVEEKDREKRAHSDSTA